MGWIGPAPRFGGTKRDGALAWRKAGAFARRFNAAAPVAEPWDEFACNADENITPRSQQLDLHDAGSALSAQIAGQAPVVTSICRMDKLNSPMDRLAADSGRALG